MTVRELLERIDARELTEWRVFDALSPLPDIRADHHAALIASVDAEANRDRKARSEAFTRADFLLFQEPTEPEEADDPERPDQEALGSKILSVFGAINGNAR